MCIGEQNQIKQLIISAGKLKRGKIKFINEEDNIKISDEIKELNSMLLLCKEVKN